jgi:hypothetical protein
MFDFRISGWGGKHVLPGAKDLHESLTRFPSSKSRCKYITPASRTFVALVELYFDAKETFARRRRILMFVNN